MKVVYVRWYKDVVEGTVVNEHDLFGMVSVRIPIQGVQSTALFKPQHIYQTEQEASLVKGAPVFHHSYVRPSVNTIKENLQCEEWQAIQQFKQDHWNQEKNMLQLEYWPEFDRMYHEYQRKRSNMMYPQQQPENFMKMDYPISDEEALQRRIIPATDNPDVTAFANEWMQAAADKLVSSTSRKKVTVTELAFW